MKDKYDGIEFLKETRKKLGKETGKFFIGDYVFLKEYPEDGFGLVVGKHSSYSLPHNIVYRYNLLWVTINEENTLYKELVNEDALLFCNEETYKNHLEMFVENKRKIKEELFDMLQETEIDD